MVTSADAKSNERLEEFERTNNGFELAELDLAQRGAGELYGLRQSGSIDVSRLPLHRPEIIAKAQQAAQATLENGYDWQSVPYLNAEIERIQAIQKLN